MKQGKPSSWQGGDGPLLVAAGVIMFVGMATIIFELKPLLEGGFAIIVLGLLGVGFVYVGATAKKGDD